MIGEQECPVLPFPRLEEASRLYEEWGPAAKVEHKFIQNMQTCCCYNKQAKTRRRDNDGW